jgi:hypothetical protein
MRLTRHARLALAACVAAQLLVVAPAGAVAPKFGSHRIVEGTSIGGIKLGMRKSKALALWGKPDGRCRRVSPYDPNDRRRGCEYSGSTKSSRGIQGGRPFAAFTFLPSGRVASIHLVLVKWPSHDPELIRAYKLAAPKVRPFRTSKGIRLRSTMQAARDAYGIPTPQNIPDNQVKDLLGSVIFRQANACTVFSSYDSAPAFTYIDSISVTAAAFCPADPEAEAPESP